MSAREFRDRLKRRARRAGCDLAPDLAESLDRYYALLSKWNRKINLTSFQLDPGGEDEAVDRLLIEPVIAARHVPPSAAHAIDIGSGGGSPAIPFTLAAPRLQLRMVESKTRKAVFLSEAVRHLELNGSIVETVRFEQLLTRPELHEAFDVLSIRAVRVEPRTLLTLQALLKAGGQIFWFTGTDRTALPAVVPLSHVATFPLLESLRSSLVVLGKAGAR